MNISSWQMNKRSFYSERLFIFNIQTYEHMFFKKVQFSDRTEQMFTIIYLCIKKIIRI